MGNAGGLSGNRLQGITRQAHLSSLLNEMPLPSPTMLLSRQFANSIGLIDVIGYSGAPRIRREKSILERRVQATPVADANGQGVRIAAVKILYCRAAVRRERFSFSLAMSERVIHS